MARSTTDTCCLTLPFKLEKWQEDLLSKRFEIARQIYNTLVSYELKKKYRIENSKEFRALKKQMAELDIKSNVQDRKQYNKLKAQCRNLYEKGIKEKDNSSNNEPDTKYIGINEYAFKHDISEFYKYFGENIGSSVAVHGIAPQVWAAFNKVVIEGKGKRIHFKKPGELNSLRGFSASGGKSGGVEIMYRENSKKGNIGPHIEWKELLLPLKIDPNNIYETEMLSHRIKYVRIIRKPGKNKPHWYAQLSLEGKPAVKRNKNDGSFKHPVGHGDVGIDIGPQTIAYSSSSEVNLLELADQVKNIEQQKRLLQRKMDRSRRATNPDNYNENGTIKRGVKLTRNKSKRYLQLQKELAHIQYVQAETRKRQHTLLANHLLSLGDRFYVEDMTWPSLASRAKNTEISEKTGKIKRKKRFGKSIANKAPATLITILSTKSKSLGIPGVVKIKTSAKASQYNHLTKEYVAKRLDERWNSMPDGKKIQRDIYSAFLLQYIDPQTNKFNQEALQQNYPQFVKMHDQTINRLSALPKTIASMGIKRSIC